MDKIDAYISRLPQQAFANNGILVVTPQGAGKTTFCKHNQQWTDLDKVLLSVGIMKREANAAENTLKKYERCATYLKKRGLRVLSSVWWELTSANAVVLPPIHVLEKRLRKKTGAEAITNPTLEAKRQSRLLRKRARELELPVYTSVEAAASDVAWSLAFPYLRFGKGSKRSSD